MQRVPKAKAGVRERHSVWWTNLGILLVAIVMSNIFGVGEYLLLQLMVTAISAGTGVWLFYVPHQFADVYWARDANWVYASAALQGSRSEESRVGQAWVRPGRSRWSQYH